MFASVVLAKIAECFYNISKEFVIRTRTGFQEFLRQECYSYIKGVFSIIRDSF